MGGFCQGNQVLNFVLKKCIKNVMMRNLVKRCMVCLLNKFVRFFLEQVPHIVKSQ